MNTLRILRSICRGTDMEQSRIGNEHFLQGYHSHILLNLKVRFDVGEMDRDHMTNEETVRLWIK